MGVYRGELAIGHPAFPAGSAAACRETAGPVDIDAPDIEYSEEDEIVLEAFSRQAGKFVCS